MHDWFPTLDQLVGMTQLAYCDYVFESDIIMSVCVGYNFVIRHLDKELIC